MTSTRLEVRLGREHKARLVEIAKTRDLPIATVVREMIDQAYDDCIAERRRRALERLLDLEVEDVPDPETINRQSESTYGVPPLP